MRRFSKFAFLALVFFTQHACSMNDLPRNQNLKAFDPHRKEFICKHEANSVPPIDVEAEQWFQQGLALTSQNLWADQRDYKKALQLWQQAADRKHWKAMLNLANAYAHGEGAVRDTERAVQIVEAAMKLSIPAAYDLMGTYHMEGLGVKQDASRAYAFWELAADMGSATAQAYLGSALRAIYDDPKQGFWGNRKVGLMMLECGYAQGNGKAAFALGMTLVGSDKSLGEDNVRALRVLHDGVKFGSRESANALFVAFNNGKAIVNNSKDRARAERYSALGDALELEPDLRLPNLDKVLPLPPARLPMWDGSKERLIDAGKAVVMTPPKAPASAPNPASQRTGRAYIPKGQMLPERPQFEVMAQFETTRAPEPGYWIARLMYPITEQHQAWNALQLPMRYEAGELFDRSRLGLRPEDGRIQFHYLGQLTAAAPTQDLVYEHPLVSRGIARYGDMPDPPQQCKGNSTCPETGIWVASVPEDHPMATVFNQWHRQAYVERGQAFPNPKAQHLDINARAVIWRYWAQANEVRGVDLTYISVDLPAAIATAKPTDDGEDSPAAI